MKGLLSRIAAVALLSSTAALADVTVNVHVAWHGMAATAAAVSVATSNPDNGFFDQRTCFLTVAPAVTDASGTLRQTGSCTVSFPNETVQLGGAHLFAESVNLITPCDDSAWRSDVIGGGAVCGADFNGDNADAPSGTVFNFIDGNNVVTGVQDDQTIEYDLQLPASRSFGTVEGKLFLPPGVVVAKGAASTFSTMFDDDGPADIQNFADLSGPNPDGSYSYSFPAMVGSQTVFGFSVRLASGSEFFFSGVAPPPMFDGQIVTVEKDASSFAYVKGTIGWGTLPAQSATMFYNGPLSGHAVVQIDPGQHSGTWDLLASPDSTLFVQPLISSCTNPNVCSSGVTTQISGLPGIPIVGGAGTTIAGPDIDTGAAFTTLSGTVTASGVSTVGGDGLVFAFNSSPTGAFQVTLSSFTFGPDGSYSTLAGQGNAGTFGQVSLNAPECNISGFPPTLTFSPVLGTTPVVQDFLMNVSAAMPSTALADLGLENFSSDTTYYFNGQWTGDSSVVYCNGGQDSFFNMYQGPQTGTPVTNLRAGPWNFTYAALGSGHSLQSPPVARTLASGGTVAVSFPSREPDLSGVVDTSSWQLGPDDSAFVSLDVSGASGDGSSFSTSTFVNGPPPGNALPLDLVVWSGLPLNPGNMSTFVNYNGPSGSSSWNLSSTVPLGTYTSDGSLPGLNGLTIAGLGSWTVTNLPVPANALFAGVGFFDFASSPAIMGSNNGGTTLDLKVPAGSYPTGAEVNISYLDDSGYHFDSYGITGEVANGDVLADTIHSPALVQRTPAPGSFCGAHKGSGNDPGDGAWVQTQASLFSDPALLKSVTIGGKQVKPGPTLAAKTLLPLGTWPLEILATATTGDQTSWKRNYTVPVAVQSAGPLGTLVPGGSPPVAPQVGVKAKGNVKLQLAVTSCGLPAQNQDAYLIKPRLVSATRAGTQLSLATIDPGGEDGDGDIAFQYTGQGIWSLNLNTRLLGTGTFVMRFQSPDRTLWDAILVVNP